MAFDNNFVLSVIMESSATSHASTYELLGVLELQKIICDEHYVVCKSWII